MDSHARNFRAGLYGAVEFFSAKQASNGLDRIQQGIGRKKTMLGPDRMSRLKQQSHNLSALIRLDMTIQCIRGSYGAGVPRNRKKAGQTDRPSRKCFSLQSKCISLLTKCKESIRNAIPTQADSVAGDFLRSLGKITNETGSRDTYNSGMSYSRAEISEFEKKIG